MDIQEMLKQMRRGHGFGDWIELIKAVMSDPTAWMCEDERGHRDTTLRRDTMDDWAYFGRKITPLFALPPDAAEYIERLQAQIDALMLEFCPDEMTPEQTERWGKNQVALNTEEVVNQQLTTDWQPIETAPKDRVIFVFRKHGTFPIHALYNPQYEWLESYSDGEHLYDLTHWMEVPKAPEAQDD